MIKKANPLRMCIVTREMLPKQQLIRIVKTPEDDFVVDFKGKLNGRGAYITNNLEVIEKCKKQKCLDRAFKQQIPIEIYNKILEDYQSGNK